MTTTISEAFGASMLDYPTDIDTSVHLSSNSWQPEIRMDGDGRISHHTQDPHGSAALLEVDTEADDESQSVEYEMTDSATIFGQDLQDMELYDVPSAGSPPHLPTEGPESLNPSQQPALATPVTSTSALGQSKGNAQDPDRFYYAALKGNSSPSQDGTGHVPDPLPPSTRSPFTNSRKTLEKALPVTPPQLQIHVISHPSAEALSEEPGQIYIQELQEAIEEPDDSPQDTHSGDPHEISDGVYIDPPPAVLLQVAAGEQTSDFFLFNSSSSKSHDGFQSPSAIIGSEVLLSGHPTLYYEPLATLSEALRRELDSRLLPDLVDGEVIFDAYDLQLQIYEDNIHAREVTLHDLNILHDGLGLSGHLRLRLQVSTPRFITRYRFFQSQVVESHLYSKEDSFHGSGVYPEASEHLPSLPLHNHHNSPSLQYTQDFASNAITEEGDELHLDNEFVDLQEVNFSISRGNAECLPLCVEGDADAGCQGECYNEQDNDVRQPQEQESPSVNVTTDEYAPPLHEKFHTESRSVAPPSRPASQGAEPRRPLFQEGTLAPPLDNSSLLMSSLQLATHIFQPEHVEAQLSEEIDDLDDSAVAEYEEFENSLDDVEPFCESPAHSSPSSEHIEYEATYNDQASTRTPSKRGYDAIDSDDDAIQAHISDSPGSKRIRIS